MKKFLAFSALWAALFAAAYGADEAADVETKLRESLRAAMMQSRELQGQIAELQAADIAKGQEIETLKSDNKKLSDQAIDDRKTSANLLSAANTKIAEQELTLTGNETAIQKWRKDYADVSDKGRKAALERDQLKTKVAALERKVEDQHLKNIQMYQIAIEVLDRYRKHGLGDAIVAREPFVGVSRAKLQTLVQDYGDKLLDQRITQ